METIAISQFKTNPLKIIAQLSQSTNEKSIIITKRGKPLAKLMPYNDSSTKIKAGKLADTLVFEKDIVSPLDEDMWEACQ